MSEEMIDIEVNLGKEMADKINKMTKQQVINALCVSALRNQVQDDTIEELEDLTNRQRAGAVRDSRSIKQAKEMIRSVMDTW